MNVKHGIQNPGIAQKDLLIILLNPTLHSKIEDKVDMAKMQPGCFFCIKANCTRYRYNVPALEKSDNRVVVVIPDGFNLY